MWKMTTDVASFVVACSSALRLVYISENNFIACHIFYEHVMFFEHNTILDVT